MNKQFKDNWKQIKETIFEKWGKLTGEDIEEIKGQAEVLIDKIVERYGISKDKASEEAKLFLKELDTNANKTISSISENIEDAASYLSNKTNKLAKQGKEYANNNPWKIAGVFATIGVLLGIIISRA